MQKTFVAAATTKAFCGVRIVGCAEQRDPGPGTERVALTHATVGSSETRVFPPGLDRRHPVVVRGEGVWLGTRGGNATATGARMGVDAHMGPAVATAPRQAPVPRL
jgi:hypothetical protein